MKYRKIWSKIKNYIDTDHTLVITGPRRVGKTTTIKWILSELKTENYFYFDLENVANRDLFLVRDYDSLSNQFKNLGLDLSEKAYVAIDEIQYVKNLPSIVKYLQDNYNIRFILSGSSSYYLKNLFSESLAGRKIVFELFPLTFSEFLDFQEVDYHIEESLQTILAGKGTFNSHAFNKLKTYYDEFIEFGGLPQVVLASSSQSKIDMLQDAYSSYINLDVQSLSDFKSLEDFRKLVRLLATRVGSKVNTSQLASVLGITRITVESYIEFMSKTYLIRPIAVHSNSEDVAIRKQDKIYFVDNGILNINADLSSGAKFENAVAAQLAYASSVSYYELKGREVDFIVEEKYVIEVKETPTKSDLAALEITSALPKVENSILIGKEQNLGFTDYLWAGQLG